MSGNQQPQGQQNPLSSFGFKPADASNTTTSNTGGGFGAFGTASSQNNATNSTPKAAPLFGGGVFGTAQNPSQGGQQSAPAPSGGIFGSSSGTQAGNLFGGAPKFGTSGGPPATTTPNPLFGNTTTQPTAPSMTSNSTFGGASSTSPAGGLFGSTPNNQPAQTGASGSAGANNPTPSGTNFFGNTQSKPSTGGLFGNAVSGTQAATSNPQPPLSIFGASSNNQTTSTQTPGISNASTAPSAPGSLFGTVPGGTSAATPAQPSPFGNFGAKPADTSSQSTAVPPSGQSSLPSLFGGNNAASKPASPAPPGTAAAPSTSSLPSLFANLPKKPETTPAPAVSSAAPSAFSGFTSLTAPKDASKDGEKDVKAATPADASGGKDVPSKDNVPAPSPFAGFSLGGNKDATASKSPATGNAGQIAATPSTTAPTVTSVPAPSMLRGKTVEDIVTRWTTELETHTREFSQFASEVAVWDRTLIENGNYISALYATVLAAESTQASLDQSLDHVEQQQRHLTATLDQYEKSASEILHGPGGIMTSTEGLGLADSERDKSYALAANLYTQLDDLSRSLTQMVETVNGLNLSPSLSHESEDASQEDAISTIAGILNAHLSSLQWIDGALNEMDSKVKDAERKIKDSSTRGGARTDGTNKSRSYGLGSSKR